MTLDRWRSQWLLRTGYDDRSEFSGRVQFPSRIGATFCKAAGDRHQQALRLGCFVIHSE